jgi:subtilisin family serine protease
VIGLLLALLVPSASAAPSASGAPEAWFATALRLDEAHTLSTGAGVLVAVVDGGVDPTVPALAGALVPGTRVAPDAAPDGLRDDDPEGHGTSMAGIIAARPTGPGGRPTGFEGVAPGARILSVSTGRQAYSDEVAAGIMAATDRGAKVINLSLGSLGPADSAERSAVTYALAHDVVVVAAAGNVDSGDTNPADHEVEAPANIAGVLAVTGTTQDGGFWDGSASGPQAVLAAPAQGILAPVPTSIMPTGAETADGTSNSAAIVSGVVALVRAEHPSLNAPAVISLLLRTADDRGPRGRDNRFGYGIVDPVAALRALPVPVAANPLLTAPLASTSSPLGADEGALVAAGSAPSSPPAAAVDHSSPAVLEWVGALAGAVLAGLLLGVAAHAARLVVRAGRAPRGGGPWPAPPAVMYPPPGPHLSPHLPGQVPPPVSRWPPR